ncbi:MAG: PD-(D/E)XK nuclease family protein [Candidatus Omnitrophica bacterium]|nr:PD-(D/E)XK nuclease family protein [Candidatus Omnitrophota bacterium]
MKKGVKRPPSAPYTINSAIDGLLKQEFDVCRENGTAHYLIKKYNIDAIPYKCDQIAAWRHNFTGVQFHHKATDFLVYGAVDDVWVNPAGELIVVDYKATGANQHQIYPEYKKQLEIYCWLLQQNGYKVSRTGYFLFAQVNKNGGFAEGKLSFDLFLEPLEWDSSWVEKAIIDAKSTIDGVIPQANQECIYCKFVKDAAF